LDDHQFALLLRHMKYSWQGFRKVRKGVKKRVARHMQEIGCRDMDAYLQRISVDKAVRAECERVMTVSISRFFRDRRMWEILETRILPDLVTRDGASVSVWFAGCAGGEEVYSFRILWDNFTAGYKPAPQLRLIATDRNPANLERAKIGCYPGGSLREVDETLKAKWFSRKKKTSTL
jgi:chemotaxis protein methyltransferase CheR